MNTWKNFYYKFVLNVLPICLLIYFTAIFYHHYKTGQHSKIISSFVMLVLFLSFLLFYHFPRLRRDGLDWALKAQTRMNDEYVNKQSVSIFNNKIWIYTSIVFLLLIINLIAWLANN